LAPVIRLSSRGMTLIKHFVVILAFAAITGCASKPPTIYYWGNYQGQVYEHLKGSVESPDGGAVILEADIEKARAEGKPLPPGYHAHLGLLYGNAGRAEDMKQQLEIERANFPESATFMDFILTNFNKQD